MNKILCFYPLYIQKGENMDKKEAWDKFSKSGKVEDYLKYKEISEDE